MFKRKYRINDAVSWYGVEGKVVGIVGGFKYYVRLANGANITAWESELGLTTPVKA